MPTGPSVMVLLPQGKSFEQFQADNAICRQWAGQTIGLSPRQTVNQSIAAGAVIGTAVGPGVGAAIIGSASGNMGARAAIGAARGLLVGTAAGANAAQVPGWQAQCRYDNAYWQCMRAKGNQIPGGVTPTRRARGISPAPPLPPDLGSAPPSSSSPTSLRLLPRRNSRASIGNCRLAVFARRDINKAALHVQ
jgi:hypothetical protein